LADSARRTPPQLTRWSVSYEDVPELVADPAGLNSVPDTLRQGEPASVSLPIANLGSVTSSPIRIQYRVTDASNATTTVARDTLAALAPDTRDTSGVRFPTKDLPGENVLTAEVSTDGPPERISNNNTVVRTFFVHPDQTAPSLTIFANGREVPPTPESIRLDDPNVPFVSTEPSFEISLRDDNPNLVLSDTSYLDVSLKEGPPSDASDPVSDFRRIPFASNQLTLLPSDSSSPGAMRARFEPTLSNPDSLYTIKVEATDTQGNSVEPPFQGSFRVQQDQVIKDVYPYPNPMSTHTTFAFRVEGGQNEMLQNFRLRIYTLAGRLVRELDETNLDSPLSVGWNTLTWNGRDEDGDRVATGVYLYRVRIEGDEQTFRGDIEKVTVIR
jgi:hypothetical protein